MPVFHVKYKYSLSRACFPEAGGYRSKALKMAGAAAVLVNSCRRRSFYVFWPTGNGPLTTALARAHYRSIDLSLAILICAFTLFIRAISTPGDCHHGVQ